MTTQNIVPVVRFVSFFVDPVDFVSFSWIVALFHKDIENKLFISHPFDYYRWILKYKSPLLLSFYYFCFLPGCCMPVLVRTCCIGQASSSQNPNNVKPGHTIARGFTLT
jgi:hypothetical protein